MPSNGWVRLRYVLSLLAGLALVSQLAGQEASPNRESRRLRLSFLGDLMIDTPNYLTLDYRAIYRELEWLLRRDDLSFANLESPVDPFRPYSGYPCFNGDLDYLRAAAEAGIEVFSLANNHVFDQGLEGLAQTLASLEAAGPRSFRRLYHSGVRLDPQVPFAPTEIRLYGWRIGFLAVCQMVNQPMPAAHVHIVDYENRRHCAEFLPYIREQASRYDLFILSYHGGREYALEPEAERVRFFDRLLEAGVDIVWAHHPHVIQPYRLVERPEGTGLIMYSTGNLISGMPLDVDPRHPADALSWTGDSALWVVIVRAGPEGLSVQSVRPIPIVNYRTADGEILAAPFTALGRQARREPWQRYYRERSGILRSAFRRWQQDGAADPP
jgi:poly-gamma-glutamate capsule biosynthesis protein CapA/YwtB (metallophosphatase superfamily)